MPTPQAHTESRDTPSIAPPVASGAPRARWFAGLPWRPAAAGLGYLRRLIPDDASTRDTVQPRVLALLCRLPREARLTLALRELAGLNHREIGQLTEGTEADVRRVLHEARNGMTLAVLAGELGEERRDA